MITPQQALARLLDNNELFHDEMSGLMRQIMSAQVAPEMVAALKQAVREADGLLIVTPEYWGKL